MINASISQSLHDLAIVKGYTVRSNQGGDPDEICLLRCYDSPKSLPVIVVSKDVTELQTFLDKQRDVTPVWLS